MLGITTFGNFGTSIANRDIDSDTLFDKWEGGIVLHFELIPPLLTKERTEERFLIHLSPTLSLVRREGKFLRCRCWIHANIIHESLRICTRRNYRCIFYAHIIHESLRGCTNWDDYNGL